MAGEDLDRVEAQRLSLEENIAKLRKALQHWRTWDAEYEGVKEDLLAFEGPASDEQLVSMHFIRSLCHLLNQPGSS